MMSKYLIIGAGYSGLQLAQGLTALEPHSVQIIEKSRGVGGRLATRRDGQFTFDHGAQFLRSCELNHAQIKHWQDEGILIPLDSKLFTAFGGMTRIAKDLAKDLKIVFESKAKKIHQSDSLWHIQDENDVTFQTSRLVLSCPLPQSLELLKNSDIPHPLSLEEIKYAKAIVFLIRDEINQQPLEAYREVRSSGVFSVASQFKKGTSALPAWTVTMTPSWSEQHFEKSDTELIASARDKIITQLPYVPLDQ
ncbi:MAG: NAD(P)-binding protein, partial [Bacillota bacterium]